MYNITYAVEELPSNHIFGCNFVHVKFIDCHIAIAFNHRKFNGGGSLTNNVYN